MTGDEMAEVRQRLGLTQSQFGSLIGYEGNRNTMEQVIKRYERGIKPIPLYLARYIWLLTMLAFDQVIAMRDDGQPLWPEWLRHSNRNEADGDIE